MSGKRSASVIVIVVALLAISVLAGAVSGTYIDVEIEAFAPWGFLGFGSWAAMEPRLAAVRIDPLAEEDAAAIERLVTTCGQGESAAAACSQLEDVGYALRRSYALTPELDTAYRVVLTNRTESVLGVVLEIDGLNTNGSAEIVGNDADRKWVLLPQQTVRISGWQVSSDEALAFRFATPSHSHSSLDALRGAIQVYVYLPDPSGGVRGTEAAEVIDQPTVRIPFASATEQPLELISFNYARGEVGLGFSCEETGGAGIRISDVADGTIAELRGLREGDVVTYVNAVPINSCADLVSYLATKRPGDRVVLKVHRAERAFLLTLELEE